jgi:hypothetical protein
MAAPRFLTVLVGRMKMVAAIATSAGAGDADKIPATGSGGYLDPTLINAKNVSAGAGDAGKVVQLDGTGRIDTTMMPIGIGADTKSILTSENIAAGSFVNVYSNAGVLNARKADATAEGKEANGFVLATTTSGQNALVYFEGTNTQLTGMTVGARQYLATTAGARTETPPSTAGNVIQYLGVALSATELTYEADDAITVA